MKQTQTTTLAETSYGFGERIRFIGSYLSGCGNAKVMDIGCGTGRLLSRPLAEAFPDTQFTLVEPDQSTRAEAERNVASLANCKVTGEIPAAQFDFVIASEVLEHVTEPVEFLSTLRSRLAPQGRLLLTVPNGLGPSEWMASLEFALKIGKRSLAGQTPVRVEGADSFADSPHIQFYSQRTLELALAAAGFRPLRFEGRMFACGFPVSLVIDRSTALQRFNVWLGKVLPLALVSDWMLACEPVPADAAAKFPAPGTYVRAKRALTTHPLVSDVNQAGGALDFFSRTSSAFRSSYDKDPDFALRLKTWRALLEKHVRGEKRALDLGCGPGLMTRILLESGFRVLAADGAQPMLDLCREKMGDNPALRLVRTTLPAATEIHETFPAIVCSSVLEYVTELDAAVARIASLLDEGGTALVSMPNAQSFYRKAEWLRFQLSGKPEYLKFVHNQLSAEGMRQLFARHGMEMIDRDYYGSGTGFLKRLTAFLPTPLSANLVVGVFRKNRA